MAQNMGLFFDSREQVYGEIDVLYSSQGCDPRTVNQRVAGSSPADGAMYSKPHGRGVSRVATFFGNILGNKEKIMVIDSQPYIDAADGDVHLALSFSIAKNAGYCYQIQILKDEVKRLGGDPERAIKDAPPMM